MYKIEYYVNVKFVDDGKHFPLFGYSGWFYPNTGLDDTQVKEAVMEDIKKNYEHHNGHTLEEDMADPAFIGVSVYGIMVCRSVDSVGVYIDGPARETLKTAK